LVVFPSLVFFVVLPLTLQIGGFWPALLIASAATAISYALWLWVTRQVDVKI
jgi:inner membrane protein involved in colicin E2 resistance